MHLIQVFILGVIQGLAEFIPISSSAHLIIAEWLFGWKTHGNLVLDVSLHMGTLIALVAYFWRDWYELIANSLRPSRSKTGQKMLLWPIIVACIPAAIAGKLLESKAEDYFRSSPYLIASTLIGMGIVLFLADRVGKKNRSMETVRWSDWITIGIAQAFALIPGVSRSGVTITAGLLCGLDREAAARFSFLLGAPVILGAGIFKLKDLATQHPPVSEIQAIVLGIVTAAVVGYLCIGFLLMYLKSKSMDVFVFYRIVLGALLIAATLFGYIKT